MVKTVKIGDKEIEFKSSAALPHLYRRTFGRDIFVDMARLQQNVIKDSKGGSTIDVESLEMFENLAYCFNKHADKSIPDDIEEWLEQFGTFDIYNILPELLAMWNAENKTTSKLKKKAGSSTAK